MTGFFAIASTQYSCIWYFKTSVVTLEWYYFLSATNASFHQLSIEIVETSSNQALTLTRYSIIHIKPIYELGQIKWITYGNDRPDIVSWSANAWLGQPDDISETTGSAFIRAQSCILWLWSDGLPFLYAIGHYIRLAIIDGSSHKAWPKG